MSNVGPNRIYTTKMIGGIVQSTNLGRRLQYDMPQIADAYRDGQTQAEISEGYNIGELYDVSESVAKLAVHAAIAGHDGRFRVGAYAGLIGKEELQELYAKRRSEHGSRIGTLTKQRKSGIFGMTEEQKRVVGKSSAISLIEKLGYKLWTEDETTVAHDLARLPAYKARRGRGVKVTEIATVLNRIFHEGRTVRNPGTVSQQLRRTKSQYE